MRVDLLEEYPGPETLARAAALEPPATVYLAAPDLATFHRHAALLPPGLEAAWWPVLPRSYWVSAFAGVDELERLDAELSAGAAPGTVLLDLELPLVRPGRFLRGARGLRGGARRVAALIAAAAARGQRVVCAEYPARGGVTRAVLARAGALAPEDVPHTKLVMAYASLIPTATLRRRVRATVLALARRWPGRVHVALGTVGAGALGREPTLSPEGLARELAAYAELPAAAVFRLGGLTDAHLAVLRRRPA